MKIEVNNLAAHLAATPFQVKGVYKYTIPPGQQGKQKTAPYPGFIFPISGRAEYQFNNTPYLTEPGIVVHGSANTIIHKRVVGKEEWKFVSILYETCKEPGDMRLADSHFELRIGSCPLLYELLNQIWSASKRPGAIPVFQVETLFHRILEQTFLSVRNQVQYGAQELFETVSEYIHGHYMEALSVSTLAQQRGVNENRLFYVFQKYSGMGPGDYLRAYRLNRARELLVTTCIPVGLIAEQVGYPDALYFSRIFKKYFGMSPNKFRGN